VTRNAIIGGGIWAALAIAGRISAKLDRSWIELLFLFAPLVIVPLGLHLTKRFDDPRGESEIEKMVYKMQLPAAIAAAISFYADSPAVAVGFGIPWLAFAMALAAGRIWRTLRIRARRFVDLCALVACFYLAVGACWMLASRLGWHPMGFGEPIVLLTAVHFHYAGFAAAILVRELARLSSRSVIRTLFFPLAAAGALAGPAVLAAGFVIGPRMKLAAALSVALGEIGLASCFIASIRDVAGTSSRMLLVVSAATVAIAMGFAALWAIGEFPGQPFLDIARMAAWHGSLNAFGFAFCGLLAFSLSSPVETSDAEVA
jgi:YndJ-like protein